MKKILLILFLNVFIFAGLSNTVSAKDFAEMDKKERADFIQYSLYDMKRMDNIDISDEKLEELFGENYKRDPDYKQHREGKNTNIKIYLSKTYKKYYTGGTYLIKDTGYSMNVETGYKLSRDNIELSYNKAGSLLGIVTKTSNPAFGSNLIKKYNRSKKLMQASYKNLWISITINQNGSIKDIKYKDQKYDIKGTRL